MEFEDILVLHKVDGFDVADAGFLGQMFDGWVLSIKFLKCRLDGQGLIRVCVQLLQTYVALVNPFNEFHLRWRQEQQSIAL